MEDKKKVKDVYVGKVVGEKIYAIRLLMENNDEFIMPGIPKQVTELIGQALSGEDPIKLEDLLNSLGIDNIGNIDELVIDEFHILDEKKGSFRVVTNIYKNSEKSKFNTFMALYLHITAGVPLYLRSTIIQERNDLIKRRLKELEKGKNRNDYDLYT